MIKLCFGRKNRTLGAIFRQTATLSLLHKNYLMAQALSGSTASNGIQAGVTGRDSSAKAPTTTLPSVLMMMDDDDAVDEGSDDEMDVDDGQAPTRGVRHHRCCYRQYTGQATPKFIEFN